MLAHPEDRKGQRKSNGEEMIRPEASPSFVHPAPLMNHESAQIYALQPATLFLTFSGS